MRATLAAAAAWGDVPTWLSAVGTLVALVFAAVAALSARKVYRIESKRDELQAEERSRQMEFIRRAQAAKVSVWWGTQPGSSGIPQWGTFIRNASETPIYQNRVSVAKLHEPDMSEEFSIAVLPPTFEPAFYPSNVWDDGKDKQSEAPAFRVEMTFTDSAGIRWIRDQQGRLSEVLPELTIWVDSQRAETLQQFSDKFLSAHQVTVAFRCPPIETMQEEFVAAVAVGETPDLLLGPHDWIGTLVARDLIDPITLPKERRAAFVDRAIEAMSWDGKLYGIPYAADSVALLRNLDLAPSAPATFEDMLAHGRSLCATGHVREPLAIQVGAGDGFYIYPIFSSAGGQIFARTKDGKWDRDVLVGDGSAAAFRRLAELGEKGERVLRREINRDTALALFTQRSTPYLVCAPWAIGHTRDAGLRFAVSPVPPFNGAAPTRSLVAVHGFFLPRTGKNKTIARELVLDFLTRMDVAEALYEAQPRPPALAAAVDKFYAANNETVAYRHQFETGELIPSTADVGQFWRIFHKAEVDVISGISVENVLKELSRSIAELNAKSF